MIAHDDIIGGDEGRTIIGSTGRHFLVLRPTLSDVVLKMPRGAQVIYPKDLGAILIAADIGPGQRVLEAGVGSGALSMTVLRAGAVVVGYELREDFAERAIANVTATLGPGGAYRVEIRDVTEGIDEMRPRPHPARHARAPQGRGGGVHGARPGGNPPGLSPHHQSDGTLCARHSTTTTPRSGCRETQEIIRRTWHVEAALGATRPPHGGPHRFPHDGPPTQRLRNPAGKAGEAAGGNRREGTAGRHCGCSISS